MGRKTIIKIIFNKCIYVLNSCQNLNFLFKQNLILKSVVQHRWETASTRDDALRTVTIKPAWFWHSGSDRPMHARRLVSDSWCCRSVGKLFTHPKSAGAIVVPFCNRIKLGPFHTHMSVPRLAVLSALVLQCVWVERFWAQCLTYYTPRASTFPLRTPFSPCENQCTLAWLLLLSEVSQDSGGMSSEPCPHHQGIQFPAPHFSSTRQSC